MPPPVGRYGPSGLAGPFPHLQQAHLQQQQQQQQQQQSQQHHAAAHAAAQTPGATGLPPPSLAGHPSFGPNTSNVIMNPFTIAGANGMGVAGFPSAGVGAAGGAGGIPDGGGTGLASHAAQLGFVRGAQMQQQQAQQQAQQAHLGTDGRLAMDGKGTGMKSRIREVWKHNLAQEMAALRALVEKYPYISMVGDGSATDF